MKVPFADLSRQYKAYKADFDRITSEVFEKGSFIFGENGTAFEKEFSEYTGTGYGIGVGSEFDNPSLCSTDIHRFCRNFFGVQKFFDKSGVDVADAHEVVLDIELNNRRSAEYFSLEVFSLCPFFQQCVY